VTQFLKWIGYIVAILLVFAGLALVGLAAMFVYYLGWLVLIGMAVGVVIAAVCEEFLEARKRRKRARVVTGTRSF
jgi:Na+-translocating ferredoxin:NAD+ oxidoreductase RnfD subunit